MGRINKYSKELKLKVVHEYIKGIKSLGNINMPTHKDIEKIRKMYYEQHYIVTEITKYLDILVISI